MSDNYQAIYDAVRSSISNGNVGAAVRDAVGSAFDISHILPLAQQAITCIQNDWTRPSVLFRPKVYWAGNKWCALYGDIDTGVIGRGNSPDAAMWAFDKAWAEVGGVSQLSSESRSQTPSNPAETAG